jgi:glycosyltransferase involved in cell wall biosynthesis
MKFSIIIPYFNKKDSIITCLESVYNQSYNNFEIIIIDDYSSTNDSKYLNNLVENIGENCEIRLFKNEKNLGPSITRNKGINYSTGDVLIFLDADDSITKNYLLTLASIFLELECSVIVSNTKETSNNRLRPNYKKIHNSGFSQLIKNNLYQTYDFVGAFCCDPIFCGCGNVAIRKECIKDVRFSEKVHNYEDWLFFYQVCKLNFNSIIFSNFAEGVIYNNQSDFSLSRKKVVIEQICLPQFLSDKNIDFRFRKYVYFNWLYSFLKRLNNLRNRYIVFFKYFRIQFYSPFPIWKFFSPSILFLLNLDIFVIALSKLRKAIVYDK